MKVNLLVMVNPPAGGLRGDHSWSSNELRGRLCRRKRPGFPNTPCSLRKSFLRIGNQHCCIVLVESLTVDSPRSLSVNERGQPSYSRFHRND